MLRWKYKAFPVVVMLCPWDAIDALVLLLLHTARVLLLVDRAQNDEVSSTGLSFSTNVSKAVNFEPMF